MKTNGRFLLVLSMVLPFLSQTNSLFSFLKQEFLKETSPNSQKLSISWKQKLFIIEHIFYGLLFLHDRFWPWKFF